MKDGKVIEFREYQGDDQREDPFWSRDFEYFVCAQRECVCGSCS